MRCQWAMQVHISRRFSDKGLSIAGERVPSLRQAMLIRALTHKPEETEKMEVQYVLRKLVDYVASIDNKQ